MNEKISIKKVLDSPHVYFPELEQYLGENIEMTITIKIGGDVVMDECGFGLNDRMKVTYQDEEDDEYIVEDECAFEMT